VQTATNLQQTIRNWSQNLHQAFAGLPDGIFAYQKIPILVSTYLNALEWKILVNLMAIFRPFVVFSGLLVYFVVIFSHFGMFSKEKSGNPGHANKHALCIPAHIASNFKISFFNEKNTCLPCQGCKKIAPRDTNVN
jgi:hypothetical protein